MPVAAVDPPRRGPHPARRRIQPVQHRPDLRRRLPRSRHPRQPHRLARLAQPRHRRSRSTAAIHHRDRAAAQLARLPARRHRRRDRALDEIDSWRPPSRPHTTFPQTRGYGSSPARPATTSRQCLQRHERSTLWFQLYRHGAASCCTTATSGPSSSATGHRRWTASPPPSGPARPLCMILRARTDRACSSVVTRPSTGEAGVREVDRARHLAARAWLRSALITSAPTDAAGEEPW